MTEDVDTFSKDSSKLIVSSSPRSCSDITEDT
jgi:hypothetical protein